MNFVTLVPVTGLIGTRAAKSVRWWVLGSSRVNSVPRLEPTVQQAGEMSAVPFDLPSGRALWAAQRDRSSQSKILGEWAVTNPFRGFLVAADAV